MGGLFIRMKGINLFLASMILLLGFASFVYAAADNVTLDNETIVDINETGLTNETLEINGTDLVNETELVNETIVDINETLLDESQKDDSGEPNETGQNGEVVDDEEIVVDLVMDDDGIVLDEESPFDRSVSYMRHVVNRINEVYQNLFYILLIILAVLLLLVHSIFFNYSSADVCFSKASSLHKRGQKAHVNGNYEKAKKLYDKSYLFREKGEEIVSGGN